MLKQSLADAQLVREEVTREMESVMEVNGKLTEENLQLRARLEDASDRLVRALKYYHRR